MILTVPFSPGIKRKNHNVEFVVQEPVGLGVGCLSSDAAQASVYRTLIMRPLDRIGRNELFPGDSDHQGVTVHMTARPAATPRTIASTDAGRPAFVT